MNHQTAWAEPTDDVAHDGLSWDDIEAELVKRLGEDPTLDDLDVASLIATSGSASKTETYEWMSEHFASRNS